MYTKKYHYSYSNKLYYDLFKGRQVLHVIQKYLEDPIAEEILKHELAEGDVIEATYVKDAEELKFTTGKKKENKRKKDAPTEEEN